MIEILYKYFRQKIREQITPKGDGNIQPTPSTLRISLSIREQITPKGDGNDIYILLYSH